MSLWISALAQLQQQQQPCVMVTVLEELGSTPRNAGSKMLVTGEHSIDSIGGGHLEFKAIQIARSMLQNTEQRPRIERFNLGASLRAIA